MPQKSVHQSGFAHLVLLLLVVGVTGAFAVNLSGALKNKDIQGVSLARVDQNGQEIKPQTNIYPSGKESYPQQSYTLEEKLLKEQLYRDQQQKLIGSGSAEAKRSPDSKSPVYIQNPPAQGGLRPTGDSVSKDRQVTIEDIKQDIRKLQEDAIRFQIQNGVLKVQNPQGQETVGIQLETLKRQIELELGAKISTNSGQVIIEGPKFKADTKLPLAVNLTQKKFVASTSAGPRVVNTLPDQAIEAILARKILSKTTSTNLDESNGELVYKIVGTKDFKVLGFIPVIVPVNANVSAETGNLLSEDTSFLSDLLYRFSF
jgi:hypothetical protein